MPFGYRQRTVARPAHTTHTTKRRRGLFSRRAPARRTHVAPAPATREVHHHHHHHHTQKRRPSMKDKVSGAMLKLKGSLTHRPGVKAAGTRRMHGTDGRGSHRRHRF